MDQSPPDTFTNLRAIIRPDDNACWETAWQNGVTPWDHGDIQPSLTEALESCGLDIPRTGRALVPGCGAAYDLPYISSMTGLETIGLEVSETAVTRAEETIEKFQSQTSTPIKATVQLQDFFEYNPPEEELFDLIYDHTFFSAIHPSLRPAWAQQMANLLKPGGYFITIAFPIDPYVEGGPPYYLRPEHYAEVLEKTKKFEKIIDKRPDKSAPSHVDREWLMIWKRI